MKGITLIILKQYCWFWPFLMYYNRYRQMSYTFFKTLIMPNEQKRCYPKYIAMWSPTASTVASVSLESKPISFRVFTCI